MALALAATNVLAAQPAVYQLSGELMTKNDEPMAYVNCVLLKAADSSFAYGTLSGEDGHFAFADVAAADYLLRITAIGYEPLWRSIQIGKDLDIGIVRMTAGTVLNTVTVTAQRPLYSVDGEKVL